MMVYLLFQSFFKNHIHSNNLFYDITLYPLCVKNIVISKGLPIQIQAEVLLLICNNWNISFLELVVYHLSFFKKMFRSYHFSIFLIYSIAAISAVLVKGGIESTRVHDKHILYLSKTWHLFLSSKNSCCFIPVNGQIIKQTSLYFIGYFFSCQSLLEEFLNNSKVSMGIFATWLPEFNNRMRFPIFAFWFP